MALKWYWLLKKYKDFVNKVLFFVPVTLNILLGK